MIYLKNPHMRHGEYSLERWYALGKLGRPLSFSKSCNIYIYVLSPIVFQLKPSKPCLNVISNHETIRDNLQYGSHNWVVLRQLKTKRETVPGKCDSCLQ